MEVLFLYIYIYISFLCTSKYIYYVRRCNSIRRFDSSRRVRSAAQRCAAHEPARGATNASTFIRIAELNWIVTYKRRGYEVTIGSYIDEHIPFLFIRLRDFMYMESLIYIYIYIYIHISFFPAHQCIFIIFRDAIKFYDSLQVDESAALRCARASARRYGRVDFYLDRRIELNSHIQKKRVRSTNRKIHR